MTTVATQYCLVNGAVGPTTSTLPPTTLTSVTGGGQGSTTQVVTPTVSRTGITETSSFAAQTTVAGAAGSTGHDVGSSSQESSSSGSSPNSSSGSNSNSNFGSNSGSSSGSEGLSSGATIGIAVGACAGLILIAAVLFCLFRNRKKDHQRAAEAGQGQSAHDSSDKGMSELGGRQLASAPATVDTKVLTVSHLSPSTPQPAAPVVVHQPWSGHELGAHPPAVSPMRGYELGTDQDGDRVSSPQEMGTGQYHAYELGSQGPRTPELSAHVPTVYITRYS